MAAEVANHAHVLRFDISLDRVTDIPARCPGPDGGGAAHHRLMCDVDQPFGPPRNFPDGKHPAGIAMPAVQDERHVDIDDVPILQWLVAGNAMTHDVVERCAGRLPVATVHKGGGERAVIHGILEYESVDLLGRHARANFHRQQVETTSNELTGLAHRLEGGRAMNLDLTGFS